MRPGAEGADVAHLRLVRGAVAEAIPRAAWAVQPGGSPSTLARHVAGTLRGSLARRAVKRAASTLRHMSGVDVKHMTAVVEDGEISEYRVDLKVAFAIEEGDAD